MARQAEQVYVALPGHRTLVALNDVLHPLEGRGGSVQALYSSLEPREIIR